ncbi:MAG: hypothetical protein V7637_1721 [Mycobacteriales bacterium]|jgi:hypothetical protein
MTGPGVAGPGRPDPVGAGAAEAGALAVLRRIRQGRSRPAGERCEMCGEPVAADHSHVVDTASRALLCTCRPCALLFAYPQAHLAYRAVPDRHRALPPLPAPIWDDLQIPVDVAFFFTNSQLGRVVGVYPSPAGATESELPLGAWDAVLASSPELAGMAPDVEALLVRARGSRIDCHLVPIDVCYELVGLLRRSWRGFDGGQDVRRELDGFFARIAERCR